LKVVAENGAPGRPVYRGTAFAGNTGLAKTDVTLVTGTGTMDRKQLEEIAQTIVERFNPVRVILFGSHARGQETEDSDLDLFVEMETDRRPPERAIEVSAVFGLRPWPLDVVVYTPAEVERLRKVKGTLLSVIETEGEVLHERS